MSTAEAANGLSLLVSRVIKANRDDVFRAWTEAEQIERWFGPEGTRITLAEVDASEGGQYRIRIESPDGESHTASGEYREVQPSKRLVFTWNWEEPEFRLEDETLVTVEFDEHEDGTEVRLSHELLPDAEAKKTHEEGWTSTLSCLEGAFH
jgi:uncharacterized protein YndB with AHSA1/START domain